MKVLQLIDVCIQVALENFSIDLELFCSVWWPF